MVQDNSSPKKDPNTSSDDLIKESATNEEKKLAQENLLLKMNKRLTKQVEILQNKIKEKSEQDELYEQTFSETIKQINKLEQEMDLLNSQIILVKSKVEVSMKQLRLEIDQLRENYAQKMNK